MRTHVNPGLVGSQPQEPTGGEATAPSQGFPSQHCFFPAC